MTEPTVTINLREYEGLLKKAQSREAGLIEVQAYSGYMDMVYFLPYSKVNEALKEEAERLRSSMKNLAKTNIALGDYCRLPWYRRMLTKPPRP